MERDSCGVTRASTRSHFTKSFLNQRKLWMKVDRSGKRIKVSHVIRHRVIMLYSSRSKPVVNPRLPCETLSFRNWDSGFVLKESWIIASHKVFCYTELLFAYMWNSCSFYFCYQSKDLLTVLGFRFFVLPVFSSRCNCPLHIVYILLYMFYMLVLIYLRTSFLLSLHPLSFSSLLHGLYMCH